jgi:hypothetical protein
MKTLSAVATNRMVVLSPVAGDDIRAQLEAKRLSSLTGRRVTFLANGKLMADVFLEELAGVLHSRFAFQDAYAVKPDMSRVTPRGLLDQLAADSHGIITGVGD